MSDLHILYISGLGGGYDGLRRRCLSWWKLYGVTAELVPMQWSDGRSYDEKFARLSAAIDSAVGKKIVLIGESAGGSMAVNMYAARPHDLYRVMTLCGKNTHPENVSSSTYAQNPAFKTSMSKTSLSISQLTEGQRREFISVHPLYDPTVPIRQTLLPQCRELRLWSVGHFMPIMLALTVEAWRLIRAVR